MKSFLSTLFLALTVLIWAPLFAQDGASGEGVPMVILEQAGGAVTRTPLVDFALGQDTLGEVAFLRFEGMGEARRATTDPDRMEVDVLGGGVVHARLLGGDGEFLDMRLSGGTRLRLSLEEFSSFRLPGRFPLAWAEPVVAASEGDRLYRRSGAGLDRIDGTLESFATSGITFETALGTKTFPWKEVAAMFLEVFEAEAPKSEHLSVVVDLVDGSRLPLALVGLTAAGLDLQTSAGRGLRLPLRSVSEVFFPGSGVQFLSDLEPSSVQETSPFGDDLGMSWPMRKDRSVSGQALRAGGQLWTRGLGVHAPSRVTYNLNGRWKHLRGKVAIDDEVIRLPAQGSVIFRLLGDGELLWESSVLRGGDRPVAISGVSVEGVQVLELVVDMADELHLGDRADWLRLVLN